MTPFAFPETTASCSNFLLFPSAEEMQRLRIRTQLFRDLFAVREGISRQTLPPTRAASLGSRWAATATKPSASAGTAATFIVLATARAFVSGAAPSRRDTLRNESRRIIFDAARSALLELFVPFVLSFHLSEEADHDHQLLGSLPALWLQLVRESAAA
jgi:hypothetical protein